MAANTIHCEVVVGEPFKITATQLDEEHQAIYALTHYDLIRIDLDNNNHVQSVYQHNRRFPENHTDIVDDDYSQDENPDNHEMPDTEDDDGRKMTNRENWLHY